MIALVKGGGALLTKVGGRARWGEDRIIAMKKKKSVLDEVWRGKGGGRQGKQPPC